MSKSNNNKRHYNYGGGGKDPSQQSKRGGGGSFNSQPTELKVLTNQNRLLLSLDDSSDRSDFMQYEVSIKNARWKKIKDETTGEERREFEARESTPEAMKKLLGTPLPWRVMKKWVEEHKIEVAYDGAEKAYFPSATSGPVDGRKYYVKVKRDCEEDDPDAERVRDIWFAVEFHQTISIPFADVMAVLRSGANSSEEISTMLNVILKSDAVLTEGMISLEPKSSTVFFPLHMQQELLNPKDPHEKRDKTKIPPSGLKSSDRKIPHIPQETWDKTKILLSGLKMTVVFQKGGAFVQTESVVQYANKEHFEIFQSKQRHRDGTRVPLLDTRRGINIAGVGIDNAHQPITDPSKRAMIEEAIGKLLISVEYVSKKPGKEGRRLYKKKACQKDKEEGSQGNGRRIIWSASDPAQFSFLHNEQKETVFSFFEKEHGITLKYPHMPIFHLPKISRFGGAWFPIELGFQAFAKSKGNNEEMVNNILKYHDVHAGKRYIDEVGAKLEHLSITGGDGARFEDRLKKWRITIESGAVEETAKILKAPRIKFKNNVARANNGSFNLNGVTFSRPAKLTSFVVVNFTNNKNSCYKFVKTVMKISRSHGIDIPSTTMDISRNDRYLDLVTVHYNGGDAVGDALEAVRDAIQKAKRFYFYDSRHVYRDKHIFFQTYCYSEQQDQFACIVLPPINEGGPLGLLLDYRSYSSGRQYFSHLIETRDGKHRARLMVKIKCTNTLIDPLDFRFHDVDGEDPPTGRHQACRPDGTWEDVSFVGFRYLCPEANNLEVIEGDIQSKQFLHRAEDWEIDFPSIVFAYKPDDGKALYNNVKVMSNYFGGIQSQCAVRTKFERQGNKDQYASNIASKINAKLSTIGDKAVSWTSECGEGRGGEDKLPWVGELPTMVVGVGMVHGMGYSSKSVVAASLCLDSGCMRLSHCCFVQKKSDTISDGVMKDIIKVSIRHYFIENKCNPERILFYRDGMSDGNFPKANAEITNIRAAVEEITGGYIPITFVICQSQQLGFRMVPSVLTKSGGKPDTNVPSGTVLECGSNSFYLIAQGGMKGTSKPVKYTVYLNENINPGNGHYGLTMQNLISCTNQMCWKYPSATKAVRELPAIKYAKRLGNQVLASLPCLEAGCHWFGKRSRLMCPAEDAGTEEEMRPYIEMRNAEGAIISPGHRQHNIVEMPFPSHLAA